MRRVCIALLICICSLARAQHVTPLPADTWKGFERTNFTIDGYKAYYVKPPNPLPGKPWVWRTSFPDWHTEMDSLLLVKGMYVVYLSIDNQYGSPYAMQQYDKLYNYLTGDLGFAFKAAMEGVSRGGLYEYAWAKSNPDKVTALYAEAPVCDIKSWPGGKLKSPGDTALWRQLKEVYGFTEEQAMAYNDNPIDNLEGLASFKVPVYHIVGIDDKLAPSAENTYPLIHNYNALGGPGYVYPVTAGPQELMGHHFPIEHADKWADMIFQNSYPVKAPLPYETFFTIRGVGLAQTYMNITEKKRATVAFLGGSITYNPGWRDKVCTYLKERFPATEFTFIAAGIPSLGSLPHAFRLQQDVLDKGKVDLLFIEAAVNDRVNGTDSSIQVKTLEGIVRHAKVANPQTDIVMMSFADEEKNEDYLKGITPPEVANHELIAEHYNLPSINLAKEVFDKIQHKEFTWADDFKDVHPSPFGQEIYFETIKQFLEICFDYITPIAAGPIHAPINKSNIDKGSYVALTNATYDKGWQLVNDWVPTDSLATREGFVHVPMLVGTTPGAMLQLPFKGNAVGMAIISGGDAGMVEYSIDNAPYKKMELYTQWSSFLHLPWYVLFGSGLKEGKHVLQLRVSADKNVKSKGNALRIVHFLVNGVAKPH